MLQIAKVTCVLEVFLGLMLKLEKEVRLWVQKQLKKAELSRGCLPAPPHPDCQRVNWKNFPVCTTQERSLGFSVGSGIKTKTNQMKD